MKIKTLMYIIMMFIIPTIGFSAETKTILLQFANQSEQNEYSTSDNLQDVIYKTFYELLAYSSEIELDNSYSNMVSSEKTLTQIEQGDSAIFVIYGSYTFSEDTGEPDVIMDIGIRNMITKNTIFENNYSAPYDMDFFDVIDKMVEDAMSVILEKAITFASIRFSNIEVVDTSYDLYLNNQKMATVSEEGYKKTLKVIADQSYIIEIIRTSDGVSVYQEEFNPSEDETITVSYDATYELELEEKRHIAEESKKAYIDFKYVKLGNKEYQLKINDSIITNFTATTIPETIEVQPGRNVNIQIVIPETEQKVYSENITLRVGAVTPLRYESTGKLRILSISNRDPESDYDFILNDESLDFTYQGTFNLPSTNYTLQLEKSGKEIYSTNFYLEEGETFSIQPRDKKYKKRKVYTYDDYFFIFRNETILDYWLPLSDILTTNTPSLNIGLGADLSIYLPRWYFGMDIFIDNISDMETANFLLNSYFGLYFLGYKMKTQLNYDSTMNTDDNAGAGLFKLALGYTPIGSYTDKGYWDVQLRNIYSLSDNQYKLNLYSSLYYNLNLLDLSGFLKYDLYMKLKLRIVDFMDVANIANDFNINLSMGLRLDLGA